jgi:hypothetical protein
MQGRRRRQRVLNSAEFANIPTTNAPPYPDGFVHHIMHANHEVNAGDGAIPAALQPVIAALATIMRRHGGS